MCSPKPLACIWVCQLNCLPDKQSLSPEHFVPEPPLLKRESQTWIMWLSRSGFLAGLKHWFQMRGPLKIFHAETQNHSFFHTCTRSLILSLENKKLPRWAELLGSVHAFFKCWLEEGLAPDESPAEVCAVTSPWVVNLPGARHSHLPLVNRMKCSAQLEEACQDIFWTCWVSVWGRSSGQQTCYVSDSGVTEMCWEFKLVSIPWCLKRREPWGGGVICDFLRIKTRGNVLIHFQA